jgi:hypothetical protein
MHVTASKHTTPTHPSRILSSKGLSVACLMHLEGKRKQQQCRAGQGRRLSGSWIGCECCCRYIQVSNAEQEPGPGLLDCPASTCVNTPGCAVAHLWWVVVGDRRPPCHPTGAGANVPTATSCLFGRTWAGPERTPGRRNDPCAH